jgi:hypothetical protein
MAGDKTRRNRAHTPQSKATQRKPKPDQKPTHGAHSRPQPRQSRAGQYRASGSGQRLASQPTPPTDKGTRNHSTIATDTTTDTSDPTRHPPKRVGTLTPRSGIALLHHRLSLIPIQPVLVSRDHGSRTTVNCHRSLAATRLSRRIAGSCDRVQTT